MPSSVRSRRPAPILLLKLTPGVGAEARALAGKRGSVADVSRRQSPRGLQHKDVLLIRDARVPDTVRLGRRTLNLTTKEGRSDFAAALGLRGKAAAALDKLLAAARADSRDELAQLTRVLCWAQRGDGPPLKRLVLSGHYAGDGVRGEPGENGAIHLDQLRRLLRIFPGAAAQVRHLMIAACFVVGNRRGLESYRALFPNLKDVTGYGAKAPSSSSPQTALHLRRWARATRRGGDAAISRRGVFGRCAKEEPRAARRGAHRAFHALVVSEKGVDRCPPPRQ